MSFPRRFTSPAGRPKPGGFTLLEMMITLTIFLILSAAIVGIVTGVLQSASILVDNQNHRDQVAALNAFLKKKLGGMSAQSGLLSYPEYTGQVPTQSGIILVEGNIALAFDAKAQANGLYTLRLARRPLAANLSASAATRLFVQAVTGGDSSLEWRPLIRDVKNPVWKFQNADDTNWLDQWDNLAAKPNLVEFSMQIAGDLQPVTMDYWIPRLDPAQLAITTQAGSATVTTIVTGQNVSTSSAPTSAAGTGGDSVSEARRTINTVSGQTSLGTSTTPENQ